MQGDGHCDTACNIVVCLFDCGDCGGMDLCQYFHDYEAGEEEEYDGEEQEVLDKIEEEVGEVVETEEGGITCTNGDWVPEPEELCAPICEASWMGDGNCDAHCFLPECNYDDGDCGCHPDCKAHY